MALAVIGAGLGGTGTASLKLALEYLGFAPCFHGQNAMFSLNARRSWERALDQEPVDWDEMFDGFSATTDLPASLFYQELAEKYPSSKVILTVRDPNAWYDSAQLRRPDMAAVWKEFPSWPLLGKINLAVYGNRVIDRAAFIDTHERHNAEVRASIPSDRLLVYEVKQGWEPLSEFLGVRIPSVSFPKVNSRTARPQDPSVLRAALVELHAGRHELFDKIQYGDWVHQTQAIRSPTRLHRASE